MIHCDTFFLVPAIVVFLAGSLPAQEADIVFTGGKVYTVNENQPWAEAVAVAGKDILFVGSTADAKKFIGDKTELVDLEGRLMLPGLIDSDEASILELDFVARSECLVCRGVRHNSTTRLAK